jgi:WD40 repeat protein
MKYIVKTKNWFIRCISIAAIILLAACSLPEVTPPVETTVPTEPSFIATTTESPSSTVVPVPVPVEISAKNAAGLTVITRAPVNTVQQIKWANDSLSLAVSTQNVDSAGTQLFGINVLDIPALTPLHILSTQDGRVADISPDGKMAALISVDMTAISLVDISTGVTTTLPLPSGFLVGNATFSPDGATLAVSKVDEWEVVLLSIKDGSLVNTLTGFETAAPIYNAGFTQSPQWIVWHARATLQLQEITDGVFGPTLDHQDFVTTYAMTRDGSMLASNVSTAGIDPGPAVTLWDAAGGNVLKTYMLSEPALCIDFSPSGSLLAMGVGNALQIWDVTSGTLLASLDGHAGQITTLAFSPDGKYIATAGNDNQLFLWQVSE